MDYLTEDLRAGLDEAHRRTIRGRGRARFCLRFGADGAVTLPLARLWEGGFALDATRVGSLPGRVDLYDGSRHLAECLIVASEIVAGELICSIKTSTPAREAPPADFVRDSAAPAGLLPRN